MQAIRNSSGGAGLGLDRTLVRAPELRTEPSQSLASCQDIGGQVVCRR
jgi:hypothetical protein